MRMIKSVVFGLVSLVCTVNATKTTGKPVLAKRQAVVTVTNNGCTAVCWDLSSSDLGKGIDCDVYCDGGFSTSMPATSTSTSTSTSTVISTVTSFTKAALNPRTVISTTNGDCIAICWDLMPGTECDVQCSSEFKTKMPGNVAHPSGANVPSKAARVANLEARENVQAHEVREARLARKFGGLVARDDTVTVTVTSIPESCTPGPESSISTTIAGIPTILPMQIPQKAGASNISAVLSQASAALSLVQQAQGSTAAAIPSAASSALSEASAFLSSVFATAPISANATVATPAPTGSAFTASATTTATSTSSETTTASTTTTGSPVVSEAGATTGEFPVSNGAAADRTISAGLVLSILVGLAANVAFLI
ncbi:MAG: hypothetical protein Q9161_000990 [Pseudevernia consocians]